MSFLEPHPPNRPQPSPQRWGAQLLGAVTFYTCIPVPAQWPLCFEGIARYAPLVGLGIGGLVIGADALLTWLSVPLTTRCGVLVTLWLLITGGLHLDGAMDAADGLAVPDRARRLEVMADSRTGAFGVMAAVIILGLKLVCLLDLDALRGWGMLAAMAWGRWGQVVAIARYPYLKAAGKGAFHKANAYPKTDWLVGVVAWLLLCGLVLWQWPEGWLLLTGTSLGSGAIALMVGAWFNRQFGGQTGDTYGAIVEWTEALVLVWVVVLGAIT